MTSPKMTSTTNPEMMTATQIVTPQLAAHYLEDQRCNRPLNRRLVAHLATEIAAGRWRCTHQGIALDEEGLLVDGQHRLSAIVAAGIPCRILVSYGVPWESVLDSVDQGVRRTAGQLGTMRGETNAAEKAAIGKLLAIATIPTLAINERVSGALVWETVGAWRAQVEEICAAPRSMRLTAAMLTPLVVMLKTDRDLALSIHAGLAIGSNLDAGHPTLVLRNHFIGCRNEGGWRQFDQLGKVVSLADVLHRNETTTRILASGKRYRSWAIRSGLPINDSLESRLTSFKTERAA